MVHLTEPRGQDGVQVTRTVWDYASLKTRTNRYDRIGQNQYLTRCHQMS